MISNWISRTASAKDMVIESSVSLSRNFDDYAFVDKMKVEDARTLVDTILCILCSKELDEELSIIKLWECSDSRLNLLVDKGVITEKSVLRKEKSAIIFNKDRTLFININEEDHIRIQFTMKELNLEKAYKYVNLIDDYIEEDLAYSFSEPFGYLTSSISNVGTGLKATVIMHLPVMSLSEEISNTIEKLKNRGTIVESLCKEDKYRGNIYKISNQITLGFTEIEIINNLEDLVIQVANEENEARESFYKKYKYELEDRVFRSYGILKNEKNLKEKEAFDLLSYVRLGSEISLLDLNMRELDMILRETKNSIIQNNYEKQLSNTELDLVRANIVKQVL